MFERGVRATKTRIRKNQKLKVITGGWAPRYGPRRWPTRGARLSRTVSLQYNALGMLLYKSDVGNYSYGAQNTAGVRPHVLQGVNTGAGSTSYGYDLNGNLVTASAGKYRTLSYTSFNMVSCEG